MIAAILAAAMSNLSAALNSLTSTTWLTSIWPGSPEADDARALSRLMTVVWAALLFALAMFSRGGGHVVEIGLSIASVSWGALLGVFPLGTLTRRPETGTIIGMAAALW